MGWGFRRLGSQGAGSYVVWESGESWVYEAEVWWGCGWSQHGEDGVLSGSHWGRMAGPRGGENWWGSQDLEILVGVAG